MKKILSGLLISGALSIYFYLKEKTMKRPGRDTLNLTILRSAALAALFAVVILGHSTTALAADVWSGCVKITGVSDFRAHNSRIYVKTSPAIAGCRNGRVQVMSGQNKATVETEKAALGMSLAAQISGEGVMFYYDNATESCFVRIVAVGGDLGQCN